MMTFLTMVAGDGVPFEQLASLTSALAGEGLVPSFELEDFFGQRAYLPKEAQ